MLIEDFSDLIRQNISEAWLLDERHAGRGYAVAQLGVDSYAAGNNFGSLNRSPRTIMAQAKRRAGSKTR